MVGANENDSILERSLRVATDDTAALAAVGRDIILLEEKKVNRRRQFGIWEKGINENKSTSFSS